MSKKKKKDHSRLLAVALLLLAGFFAFLFFLPESKSPKNSVKSAQSKEFEERVNRHLFKTSQSMELSREKMKIEADRLASQGVGALRPSPEKVHPLDLSTDPKTEALLQALGREARVSNGPSSPDEQIQADLFESQQLQEYSEEYKREYARQFVENARKAGYIIKLNDDYKVISVRPLRKPTQNMELFQSEGRAVR